MVFKTSIAALESTLIAFSTLVPFDACILEDADEGGPWRDRERVTSVTIAVTKKRYTGRVEVQVLPRVSQIRFLA